MHWPALDTWLATLQLGCLLLAIALMAGFIILATAPRP